MNLFKFFIPTEDKKEIEAIISYEVRWKSRFNEYSTGTRTEVRVFLNESAAIAFKQALVDAFALIKTTVDNKVTLTEVSNHD